MGAVITVVIPVYNGEKYITRAVNSILEQPAGNRAEILIVNDGSQDATKTICDDLAKKHANVRVIHKENSGVALSRNLGIENVSTKYIAFLDCDDWWEKDFLDAGIVQEFEKDDSADVYQFAFQEMDKYCCLKKVFSVQEQVLKYSECGLNRYDWSYHCSFVFRTMLLHKNGIRYPVCKIGEDGPFVEMALFHSTVFKKIDKVMFTYWKRASSCVHSTPRIIAIEEEYKGGLQVKKYFEQYGVLYDADESLVWTIANSLPRLCATCGYNDLQHFMEEYCFPILVQRPEIHFRKELWSRLQKWQKGSRKYWIKNRIRIGTPVYIKQACTRLPFLDKLVNYIHFRFLRGFTPAKS